MLIFSACHKEANIPEEVRAVINKAGRNKKELTKVIAHYSKKDKDTLKLKAAFFLIKNLDGWYYYKGDLLDKYLDYLKLIRRDRTKGEYFMNSFNDLYGPFSLQECDKHMDLREIKSDQLVGNIDMAFKVWREQPWGKDISFDQFCNFILPFRIQDEKPEYNRANIYRQYNQFLDSVIAIKTDAVAACRALNEKLMDPPWLLTQRISFLPHFSASHLLEYHVGSCRDMTDMAIFAMRATGIPVAIDFLPQWPYRSSGHTWNVVLTKHGKTVMFLGAEDSPGTLHKPFSKKGKVYRYLFVKNPSSLAMQKGPNDIVPPFLLNPRIEDVTDQYAKCFQLSVSLLTPDPIEKLAYLTVFDNKSWSTIDWGRVKGNIAKFSKVEGGIVYLPAYYKQHRVLPANWPFILRENGVIRYLKTDSSHLNHKLILDRTFPVIPDWFLTNAMVGGTFQGANDPDFKDATNLYTVASRSLPFWNSVSVSRPKKFRYVRYLSPYKKPCVIGEMEFYHSNKKLFGQSIGTKGSKDDDPGREYYKATDGAVNTFFEAKVYSDAWTGLDLKKPVLIDMIRFSSAFRDKGALVEGNEYELFYWDRVKQWVSVGTKIFTKSKLTFYKLPSNALYQLKDRTDDTDSRIFTYENGRQVWW